MIIPGIYNVLERIVLSEIDAYFTTNQEEEVCQCKLCVSNIAAYALNRLPSKYVSSLEGEARFQMEINAKYRWYIKKMVNESVLHVSKNPHRHNRTLTEKAVSDLLSIIETTIDSETVDNATADVKARVKSPDDQRQPGDA